MIGNPKTESENREKIESSKEEGNDLLKLEQEYSDLKTKEKFFKAEIRELKKKEGDYPNCSFERTLNNLEKEIERIQEKKSDLREKLSEIQEWMDYPDPELEEQIKSEIEEKLNFYAREWGYADGLDDIPLEQGLKKRDLDDPDDEKGERFKDAYHMMWISGQEKLQEAKEESESSSFSEREERILCKLQNALEMISEEDQDDAIRELQGCKEMIKEGDAGISFLDQAINHLQIESSNNDLAVEYIGAVEDKIKLDHINDLQFKEEEDPSSYQDQERALTSRQEEILEMKQSLGELKSIRDPSPDTARRIRREQEKLDDLMARERIDEVREKLRSLRKILNHIERDNEIDRARLNDDLGNEWEQHKKTTEEIRESIDERRDLLHQVEMYMNDLKED